MCSVCRLSFIPDRYYLIQTVFIEAEVKTVIHIFLCSICIRVPVSLRGETTNAWLWFTNTSSTLLTKRTQTRVLYRLSATNWKYFEANKRDRVATWARQKNRWSTCRRQPEEQDIERLGKAHCSFYRKDFTSTKSSEKHSSDVTAHLKDISSTK